MNDKLKPVVFGCSRAFDGGRLALRECPRPFTQNGMNFPVETVVSHTFDSCLRIDVAKIIEV
jgi:hypothetical protein